MADKAKVAEHTVTVKTVRMGAYDTGCATAYFGGRKIADVCWSSVDPNKPYHVQSGMFGKGERVRTLEEARETLQRWARDFVMSCIDTIIETTNG